jgi:thiamine-phosphate pyrophosphorylase
MKPSNFNFYFITDSHLSNKGNVADVLAAVGAGAWIIQYREKNLSPQAMIDEAKELKKICEGRTIFLINDKVDVCLAVDADGVHLGQGDMDLATAQSLLGSKIIGVTVHNVEEAVTAQRGGAAYVGISPVYSTFTKDDAGDACGPEMITRIRKAISIPIVAVGGITKLNAPDVIKAGADSVAAISATVESDDVKKEVEEFNRIIRENKGLP